MSVLADTIPSPLRLDSHGVLRIGETRVPLEAIVYGYNNGQIAEEIQRDFDTLTLTQVYSAIAFYLNNMEDVDEYVLRQEEKWDRIRAEHKAKYPSNLTREILEERRRAMRRNGNE